MKQLIILTLIFITTLAYAQDKGWKVAVDKTTGEVVEATYGDGGIQHRIDQGYKIIIVPSKDMGEELEDYVYNKKNIFSQKKTFRRRPQAEIDARKQAKELKEKQRRIIELEIKKDMAKKKGFKELELDYQKEIDNYAQ